MSNYTNKDIQDMFPSNYDELDSGEQAAIIQDIARNTGLSVDQVLSVF